jgi:hypothetical protein
MSVVSGIVGAIAGSDATRSAANTAADAQNTATAQAKELYQAEVERMSPFYEAGKAQLPTYQRMLSGDYSMKESPAAQYQLEKGTKAMNRALASRGLSGSGNAAQRLTELNQSVASSDWNAQYSRILDALKLGTGASASMGAASNTFGNQSQTAATNLGNIAQQQGANQASLYSGMAGQGMNAAALGIKGYQAYNAANPATNNSQIMKPDAWDTWDYAAPPP